MLLSLILWSCASKSVPAEVETEPVDARTGTMVAEADAVTRPEVRLPSGQPIARECFGGSSSRRKGSASSTPSPGSSRSYGGPSGGSNGSTASTQGQNAPSMSAPPPVAATSAPTTPAPVASPPPPPAKTAGRSAPSGNASGVGGLGGSGSSGASGYGTGGGGLADSTAEADNDGAWGKSKATKPSAPKSTATKPAAEPRQEASEAGAVAWGDAEEKEEAAPRAAHGADKDDSRAGLLGKKKADSPADGAAGERARELPAPDSRPMTTDPVVAARDEAAASDARFDWGGVTYLSNDDSMSLASAQRVLWAVQNRGPVKTSEVRPHELLNYFSFDTTPVPAGDTFSVLASADQTDSQTLSMAFAVKGVTPEHKPLDLTLVLDRSGSMEAEGRMEYLKRGLTKMTDQLERGDRVDIVLFDDSNCVPLENYVVGRDDPGLLSDVISSLAPRGSTDLDGGLKEGYRIAKAHTEVAGRNRRMLLISDALLNTGEVNVDVVSEIGKSYEDSGIRLSAIGVGRDFNDKVLDQLSEKGKGAYVYLGSEAVVDRVFGAGFQSLVQTVAHDVHFSMDLPPSLAMEKFYGEESSTHKEDVQPINYYAGTTQLFVQDLRIKGSRPVRSDVVKLTAEWTDVDSGESRTQTFTASVGSLLDADPHNLEKGRALLAWSDLILARSLGNDPCGAPYSTWDERTADLGDDAEIAWLDGLTAPLCGQAPSTTKRVAKVSGVPYKVKVDADQVIAEVAMQCGGKSKSESLSAGSNVVRFEARPGDCQLVFYGNVPMMAEVEVPATGGDIRCVVRGGRLSCG